jgi:hypothetical protein
MASETAPRPAAHADPFGVMLSLYWSFTFGRVPAVNRAACIRRCAGRHPCTARLIIPCSSPSRRMPFWEQPTPALADWNVQARRLDGMTRGDGWLRDLRDSGINHRTRRLSRFIVD